MSTLLLIDYALILFSATAISLIANELRKRIKLPQIQRKSPYILRCKNVTFNMQIAPHLLVAGLSGQGKSMFVEYLFKDRKDIDNVYLVNAYRSDFKSLKCKRINSTTNTLKLLTEVYTELQKHPRYIIVDELLELSIREPKIIKELTKALAVSRHFNTFFICIAQQATKEEIKCKSLFNCRVTFKQVEYSSYQTILGYSPEDRQLQAREFYYLSDCGIGRAKVPRI